MTPPAHEIYTKFHNQPSEVAALMDLCGDPQLALTSANIPHPYTREDAINWITGQDPDANIYAIRDPAIVGSISYSKDHQIGYWIGRPHWGRGYATRALAWMLCQPWCNHGLVWAAVQPANGGSKAVLIRNSFIATDETVTLHDTLRLNGLVLQKYKYECLAERERVFGGPA